MKNRIYVVKDGSNYLADWNNHSITYASGTKPILLFASQWLADFVAQSCDRLSEHGLSVVPFGYALQPRYRIWSADPSDAIYLKPGGRQ